MKTTTILVKTFEKVLKNVHLLCKENQEMTKKFCSKFKFMKNKIFEVLSIHCAHGRSRVMHEVAKLGEDEAFIVFKMSLKN